MKIKAIIFDLDGTLVNIEERFYHHYNRTLVDFDIEPLDRDVYEKNRVDGTLSAPVPDEGNTLPEFWLHFIKKFSYSDLEDLGCPLPGIPEALEILRSREYPMAIVTGRTSTPDRVIEELTEMGIVDYFRHVLTNEEGIKGMDKSAALIKSARMLGFEPAECAYIGDWEGDVISAAKAEFGLVVAVISGGQGKESLEIHSPDVILDSVANLPDFFSSETQGAR